MAENCGGGDFFCCFYSDMADSSHESAVQPGDAGAICGASEIFCVLRRTDREECYVAAYADHAFQMGGWFCGSYGAWHCAGADDGMVSKFEAFTRPLFELVRPIPTLAWIPLVILWCGIGEMAKYVLVFIGAFMSIVQNAYHGAKSVDRTIVNAARMLGCNDRQMFFTIVIPASVPAISAGLQIALPPPGLLSWRRSWCVPQAVWAGSW